MYQPVAGSLSRPSRWSKRRKKRFAVDGEEGPQGLIVRQDELEDAPDDQLPPRAGERRDNKGSEQRLRVYAVYAISSLDIDPSRRHGTPQHANTARPLPPRYADNPFSDECGR